MNKFVIFDFDGTLADTFELGSKLLNSYAKEFGYNKIDFEKHKNSSAKELIKLSGVRFWKIPHLLRFFRKKSQEKADEIKPFSGIIDLIKQLKKENYKLGIITTNSSQTIDTFIKINGLEEYFSFIKTEVSLFGKKRALKKASRLNGDFLYIGDELRDIEACNAAKKKIISVSWGFNSFEILKKNNPFVAKNTQELYDLITIFSKQ